MVLTATYPDGKLFYNLVASMDGMIDECLFTITVDGIRISRLDNHQDVMVDLWLPKESFLRYNLQRKDDEQEIGVSIPQLKKVLSWITEDPMEIHARDKKVKFSQKLTETYEEKSVEMPTVDFDRSGEVQPSDQPYDSCATFSNSLFSTLLRINMENHDTVALTITETTFVIELQGNEHLNDVKTLHRFTADPNLKINTRVPEVRQLLPTNLFKKFGHASGICNTVDISMMGEEKAVKVSFNIDDTGYFSFYIAPKIEAQN